MANVPGTAKLFVETYKTYGANSTLEPIYDYSDALININTDSHFNLPNLGQIVPAYYIWIKRIDENEANLVIIPYGTDIINSYSDTTISPGDDLCLIADPKNGQWIFKKGYIAYIISLSQQALLGSNYLPGSIVYFQQANAIVNAIGPYVSNGSTWTPMGQSGVDTFGLIYGSGSISTPSTSVQMLPTTLPHVMPIYDGSAWVYTNNFLNQYTYVSNSGNNLTGAVGDQYFPFATIDAAIAAGGTFIYITTGSYDVPSPGTSYVKSNVTLVFEPSVYFNSLSTDTVFNSNVAITNFNIYGSPNFNINGPAMYFNGFPISLTNSYIELGVINSTFMGVNIQVGDSGSNYELRIQSLNVPGPAVVLFGSGIFVFDNIISSDPHSFQVFATNGDFFIQGNVILSGLAGDAISYVYPNAGYNIYLNVNQLIDLNIDPTTPGTLFIKSNSINTITTFSPCTVYATVISLGNCTFIPTSQINLNTTTCGTITLGSGHGSSVMNFNIKNFINNLVLTGNTATNTFNINSDNINYSVTGTPLIAIDHNKTLVLTSRDVTSNYILSSSNCNVTLSLTNVKTISNTTNLFNVTGGLFNYTGSLMNLTVLNAFNLTSCTANIKCETITATRQILTANGGCTIQWLVLSTTAVAFNNLIISNDTLIIKNAYVKSGLTCINCTSNSGSIIVWNCIFVSGVHCIAGAGTTPVRYYGNNASNKTASNITVVLGTLNVNALVS